MKDIIAILIILKRSQIKNINSLPSNFDDPDELPELELELEDTDNIVVASGQH
jgi:hypothetical protein